MKRSLPFSIAIGLIAGLYSFSITANEIRIGYQKSAISLALIKARGELENQLKQEGHTVSWKEFPAGPQQLEALNVGSIDLASTGDAPPIYGQANGTQFVYVGNEPIRSQSSAILIPLNSPIKDLRDLKGKRVAVPKGSSGHYFLIKALDSVGLKLEDISPAYLQHAEARAAFEQGAVDAWVSWDPYYAAIEQTGQAKVLIDGSGYVNNYTFYLSNNEFAKNNRKALDIIFKQLSTNDDYVKRHLKEAIGTLSSTTGLEPKVFERIFERRPSFKLDYLRPAVVADQQKVADRLFELKLIDHPIVVQDIVFNP